MAYLQHSSAAVDAQIMRLMNSIPIFASMNVTEQHLVSNKCIIEQWGPNQIIIEEKQLGNRLYVIIKGEVVVSKLHRSKGWVNISTLAPGEFFGEIAILCNVPRTARITTKTACELLSLSDTDFLKIYQIFPQKTRDNIQIIIAKRLKELSLL